MTVETGGLASPEITWHITWRNCHNYGYNDGRCRASVNAGRRICIGTSLVHGLHSFAHSLTHAVEKYFVQHNSSNVAKFTADQRTQQVSDDILQAQYIKSVEVAYYRLQLGQLEQGDNKQNACRVRQNTAEPDAPHTVRRWR